MKGIWLVTLARLREPAFVIVFLVGALISWFSANVGSFEVGEQAAANVEAVTDPALQHVLLGTVLLTVLGMLITVFIAASEVPRDVSSRMIAVYLAKPVSRSGYLLGKYLGSLSIGGIFAIIWISIMMVNRYVVSAPPDIEPLTMRVLSNQYLCLLMLVPTCAVSITISCFFSDVISMILTCVYVLLSFVVALVPYAIKILDDTFMVKLALMPPYYLLPNLTYFLRVNQSTGELFSLLLYTASVTALFLFIGRMRFDHGDIFTRD